MNKLLRTPGPTVLLAGILALAVLAGPASAYTIFLKDGTSMSAQEKYEVRGERAWFTLQSGSLTSIRFADIDIARTDGYNRKHGYDVGLVLEGKIGATPADAEATLQDLIRARRGSDAKTTSRSTASASANLRQTPAGYDDLMSFVRHPLESTEIQAETLRILRKAGVRKVSAYQGSNDHRVLVEVVTDNKAEVLRALEATCKATLVLQERYQQIEAVELLLQTAGRDRAGQFLLTSSNAPLLAESRITAIDFFVEHVQF